MRIGYLCASPENKRVHIPDREMWTRVAHFESDHILQVLQQPDLDNIARWLGLECGLFAGEGIDALTPVVDSFRTTATLFGSGNGPGEQTAVLLLILHTVQVRLGTKQQ